MDDDEEDAGEDKGDEDVSGSITEEIFSKRISISEFTIDAEGDYTSYYDDDDDMFYGHVIVIDGNLKGGMRSADIAG